MQTYVIDTSVVVKWYNTTREQHIEYASKILNALKNGKINIIVPNILVVELINACINGKLLPQDRIEMMVDNFFLLPLINKEITPSLVKTTTQIMQKFHLTSYDALFVALAKQEKCKLISDDSKGHGKITDGSVIMLKNYMTLK